MASAADTAAATIALRLRQQASWCRALGSPLYTRVLEHAAADVEAHGPCWGALAGHEGDRFGSALALRFMAAVHRLVLEGHAPALARCYPSAGGDAGAPGAWAAFRATVEEHRDRLRALVGRPVQTNEVRRTAALLGGFLLVARTTGLPLRVLEVGASAGLNLRWDHYRYETARAAWGDPGSPVRLSGDFVGGDPPLEVATRVAERAGCDLSPIDPCSSEGQLTLHSFLWADQVERATVLRAALAVARRVPAMVERAEAVAWLGARLAAPAVGLATVVFHSIVLQYLEKEQRARLRALVADAGGRARAAAPLAWLRMEPGGAQAEVRLTLWPGGEERLLATAAFQGGGVRWHATA